MVERPELPASVLAELRSIVGEAHVLVTPDLMGGYELDWTGRFGGRAPAVVRPGSVEEVAAVLALCSLHRLAVVPQGGNTGLVGGGVPMAGELVMSLRRLDRLAEVDMRAAQVSAGSGVTLGQLQQHVRRAGLDFPVDLASRDSATLGGMAATNAGGAGAFRHGSMRSHVAGVEAVLADGRIVRRMNGLTKDNTGYDLAGLLTGSEGTLAVITAVRLRLVTPPAVRAVALVGLADLERAIDLVGSVRTLAGLESIEVMFEPEMDLVCSGSGVQPPFRSNVYVLLGAGGAADPFDALASVLGPLRDVAVALDPAGRGALVHFREAITESVNHLGVPVKLDVTVPFHRLTGFVPAVRAAVKDVDPAARCFVFGHLGDANLHVNVVGGQDEVVIEDTVLRLVASVGGSVGGEHGIGTTKRRWLHLTRSENEVGVMRLIKGALDPAGILNPNVLLP